MTGVNETEKREEALH